MNAALLSSKKMDYCTPQDFFDRLNDEFGFVLDAAATTKRAKGPAYHPPETDALNSPRHLAGGGPFGVTLHTDGKPGNGFAKPMKNPGAGQRLFF